MKTTIVAAIAALVSGCVSVSEVTGPSGGQAFVISCPLASIEKCYTRATEECGGRYHIVDRTGFGRVKMMIECVDS